MGSSVGTPSVSQKPLVFLTLFHLNSLKKMCVCLRVCVRLCVCVCVKCAAVDGIQDLVLGKHCTPGLHSPPSPPNLISLKAGAPGYPDIKSVFLWGTFTEVLAGTFDIEGAVESWTPSVLVLTFIRAAAWTC